MAKLIIVRMYSFFAARCQDPRVGARARTYKGCEDLWVDHRNAQFSGFLILFEQQLCEMGVREEVDSWLERLPYLISRDQCHVGDAEKMGWKGVEDISFKGGLKTLACQGLSFAQAELGDGRGTWKWSSVTSWRGGFASNGPACGAAAPTTDAGVYPIV